MDFTFINELSILLNQTNIFKFSIIGAKSMALALLLFKILETYIRDFESETPKFGNIFNIFGYAFLIMSSDWIIEMIEGIFSSVNIVMGSTESNLYTDLNMELEEQYAQVTMGDDLAWYDYISLVVGNITFFTMYIVALLLMAVCKIADLAMTAGYLLSRLFSIQLMKFIFPIVIALSTLDQTKDLLGKWIKRYIGLFILGIAYIGIIHFTALVQTSLLNQFTTSEALGATAQIGSLNKFTWGMIITIIVVFTLKVKLFSLATSNVTNFFS